MKFLSRFLPKFEKRDADYTDAVVSGLLALASGDVASGLTAGVEIASGQWQRAFASAQLQPEGIVTHALRPHLGYIGRSMVERGEAVFAMDFTGEGFHLLPAASVTVAGGPDPASWVYELSLAGPSETVQRQLPAGQVLHLFYSQSPASPWKGVSPIEASGTTRKLLDNIEQRLAQETGQSVGALIPVPNVQSTEKLQRDLRDLKGEVTLVESTAQGWGAGQSGAPAGDFQVLRIGADPPETLPTLRRQVEQSILAACGVPTSVLDSGQGTASREAYRQFLHLTIIPVALEVGAQIAAAFDIPAFAMSFDRLMASDLSGRARASQSMVGGGMDLDRAARLAGLMEQEE